MAAGPREQEDASRRSTLTNKHAVVTGSTAGIGFASAQGLAEAGATVAINGGIGNR
jgi:NAD(P)-dependent dehydrogenase (short-subunit alcohol dehydrogenase family)